MKKDAGIHRKEAGLEYAVLPGLRLVGRICREWKIIDPAAVLEPSKWPPSLSTPFTTRRLANGTPDDARGRGPREAPVSSLK